MSVDGIGHRIKGPSRDADLGRASWKPTRMWEKHNKGECWMKFRLFRLATTVAMLAVLIEALGAGCKWG